MNRLVSGLMCMLVFSVAVATNVFAEDYLTINEPGYSQEVLVYDIVEAPSRMSAEFTDWEGNYYFTPDQRAGEIALKKVTPDGMITEFASIPQAPDELLQFRNLRLDAYGNLHVVLFHYVEGASTVCYPLVKISGFTPLSESASLTDLQYQVDRLDHQTNPGSSSPALWGIGDQTGKVGESFIIRKIAAEDSDGDYLTIEAENLPEGMRFFRTAWESGYAEYRVRWPASHVRAGAYNVTFTVSDGDHTDSEAITIVIPE